ncbi:microcystin-dependent protein [Naegleria gruberi]|uniref:Microcystin-dependent protein n=1 Tax=Naegleria gruberi TaxID=5762 RepID=D2V5I7_NAEGR|nr:microcystin-dependent protein [Naegleria gruberi]EFC47804.1 microcystin-dependent protein [Naegleria gruberi]|eukprot:XP_002680548.1 microcystin-dependent protein [Naegleria gruberi strain NEG-M]
MELGFAFQLTESQIIIPVGIVNAFAGTTIPAGWLLCDGATYPNSHPDYIRLFQTIGNAYGSTGGPHSFNVPDLRGRAVVGIGHGAGLSNRTLAQKVGEESHQLQISELPSHSHSGTTGKANKQPYIIVHQSGPISDVFHTPGWCGGPATHKDDDNFTGANHTHNFTTNEVGGNSAHENMQPSLVLNYIIKY